MSYESGIALSSSTTEDVSKLNLASGTAENDRHSNTHLQQKGRRLAVLCLLLRSVVWVCRDVPSDRWDRRAEIGAGCSVSLSYNSCGFIDTNITEGSIS